MTLESTARILVVDDLPDNLDLVRDVLDQDPYEIVTARSAGEAVRLTEAVTFDAAILDVQMPGTDGYELCRTLRDAPRTRHLPIVFLTAHRTSTDDAVEGLELGACDYVSKPFNAQELRARLRAILRRTHDHRRELRESHAINRRLQGH